MSRPMVPFQSEMVDQLQMLLETCGVESFLTQLPNFPLKTQIDVFLDQDWLKRHQKSFFYHEGHET